MIFSIQILLLFVLLFFSAFFSGSETALFSLNSFDLRRMKGKFKNTGIIEKLLKKPSELLVTILIGNLLVNIALSSLVTYIGIRMFGKNGVALAIFIATFLLLIIGEITPKTLAIKNASQFASMTVKPMNVFHAVILPVRILLLGISNYFIEKFSGKPKKIKSTLSPEEFETVIKVGQKEGVIEKEEKKMIQSVLNFRKIPVSRIMIPRVDVKAASVAWNRKKITHFILKTMHSKIPVYENSEDKMVGVVYAKDILLKPDMLCKDLMKSPIFVPETKTVDSLFEVFLKEKRRMAIVVDEYGGTSGIVTLEDILEEIFGEIYDEYEIPEVLIKKLGPKKYRIRGKTPLHEINELLNLNLPEDEFDTIAGFALSLFQEIPGENEVYKYGSLSFTIERIIENRIDLLLLEKK